jgi:outer membrane lipoprotein
MPTPARRPLSCFAIAVLVTTLSACAPAPIYKAAPDATQALPMQVAQTPERYQSAAAIWGGTVVQVNNLPDRSEIEMLAFPLDSSQRPKLKSASAGRFIAIVPGYVEPLKFPSGTPMTFSGHISGVRSGKVGNADYVFPLLKTDQSHAWTAEEMRKGHPNFNFGVGMGVGSGGRSGVGVGVGVH